MTRLQRILVESKTISRSSVMAPRCFCISQTLAPFLYPSFAASRSPRLARLSIGCSQKRSYSSSTVNDLPESRLNPAPDDYASPKFADNTHLTLYAGRGGNGCVSFLREMFLPDGPPNGGDGGSGGNIYIQAAHGETTLHKLARKRFIRAGRGKHGQGSAKGGTRGEDVIITVPVGTVVREVERHDPVTEEDMEIRAYMTARRARRKAFNLAEEERKRQAKLERLRLAEMEATKEEQEEGLEEETAEDLEEDEELDEWQKNHRDRTMRRDKEVVEEIKEEKPEMEEEEDPDPRRHKWLLYPGMSKNDMKDTEFPKLPRRMRHLHQPPAPIMLDLSRPTPEPILLATGGIGGLGNPHFVSRDHPKPMFATKGDDAVTMKIELELKLLADVGLVGLPNAGKSTLLRALTNSRTRIGNWAFTTLQPNIGTVVLDKYSGRPAVSAGNRRNPDGSQDLERRTRFSVADIPGLIEGAHLDRGLGIAFLRHVERAGVLAFVIDLSAGNAVRALQALWREVGLYAQMREEEEHDRKVESSIDWDISSSSSSSSSSSFAPRGTINLLNADVQLKTDASTALDIAGKPWFVVATKADLPETRENYKELKTYLDSITSGEMAHPSGVKDAWTKNCSAIPVSAIKSQGIERIVHWTVGLLDE